MSSPSVVLIGLPPKHDLVPRDLNFGVAEALENVVSQMAQAGIDYEFIGVTPEEGVADLGRKLQARHRDVVVIGNGIRREMDLTPFMEQIIDVIRQSVPQAKLGFNTRPDDTINAAKRWLPEFTAAKLA